MTATVFHGSSLLIPVPHPYRAIGLSSLRMEGLAGLRSFRRLRAPRAFLHRSPPPGQTTHYRVFAINKFGDSPASNIVNIKTAANPPTRLNREV